MKILTLQLLGKIKPVEKVESGREKLHADYLEFMQVIQSDELKEFLALETYVGSDAFHKERSVLGLYLQRHTINDNHHFRVSSYTLSPFRRVGDFINHRVNINAGLRGRYTKGRVSLFGTVVWTRAYNYGRFKTATYPNPGFFRQEMFDRTNIHLQAGVSFTP